MTGKQKILDALDCVIDDLSEDRLIDLLVDAYEAKKRRINELAAENARERESLHHEREMVRAEIHRVRTDPLYTVVGEFCFQTDKAKFGVRIHGGDIQGFEQRGDIHYAARRCKSDWTVW